MMIKDMVCLVVDQIAVAARARARAHASATCITVTGSGEAAEQVGGDGAKAHIVRAVHLTARIGEHAVVFDGAGLELAP